LPEVLTPEERLERTDELIEELKRGFVEAIEHLQQRSEVDGSFEERWVNLSRRIGELRGEFQPEDYDKDQIVEVYNALWEIKELLEREPSNLDVYDQLLLRLERIRHVVRDALDEHVAGIASDAGLVLQDLDRWLPHTPDRVIAELVGVDRRTLSRWRKQSKPPARRLREVARLVAILAHNWSEEGIVAWFYRGRRDLNGRRPITLLDDPMYDEALLSAARSGRSQYAT
jgi:uncharacterized protein (DUF2384 family)